MHSDLSCIFSFLHIQLKSCPSRPPEAPIVLSQHSSLLSQAQLFLIPSTALSYPGHSSILFRRQLFLIPHSSFISDAQLFYILCTRYAGAVFGIRKSCVSDKKELCRDKTIGAFGGLSGHFLSWILKKWNMYDKSDWMKIILRLNPVYGGYCL